jgi:hypothetical protein
METSLQVYSSRSTALLAQDAEKEIKETTRKIQHLLAGGKALELAQAVDLAVYSYMTGYNPFNYECYYMDGVGPIPGIAGYRVKAADWLAMTSNVTTTPRLWEEYRPAEIGEADFDPDKGDIAWVCTLKDSVSQEHWEGRIINLGMEYHQMGATFQEAHDAALKDVGSCPQWTAVGVVHGDEHFSKRVWIDNKVTDEYKPEMWDRNERAKKRAAKGCYRKGFPKVNFADKEFGQDGDIVDSVATEVKDEIKKELTAEAEAPKKSPDTILAELGYGEPKPTTTEPWPESIIPPEPEDPEPAPIQPVPAEKPWPIDARGTIITAQTIVGSDKVRYWDLDDATLVERLHWIRQSLKKPNQTAAKIKDLTDRENTIMDIQDWRKL